MTANLDTVELIWILINVAGVVIAFNAYRDAIADEKIVGKAYDGDPYERQLACAIVHGDVVSAIWILGIEAGLLSVGFLAGATPPPAHGRSPLMWVVVSIFIAVAAALPLRGIDQRRRRRKLLTIEPRLPPR